MRVDGVAAGPAVAKWSGPFDGGRPDLMGGGGTAAKTGPNFNAPVFNSARDRFKRFWVVSGISKDSTGAVLVSCTVDLFRVLDASGTGEPPLLWLARTISDSVTGAYSFSVPSNGWVFQAIAYKSGSPDVAGITVNTLTPVLT